jgi:hypothetical protein
MARAQPQKKIQNAMYWVVHINRPRRHNRGDCTGYPVDEGEFDTCTAIGNCYFFRDTNSNGDHDFDAGCGCKSDGNSEAWWGCTMTGKGRGELIGQAFCGRGKRRNRGRDQAAQWNLDLLS